MRRSGGLHGLALGAMVCCASMARGEPMTYQGRLLDAGVPVDGTADLEFRVFTASVGAGQVGPTLVANAWPIDGGLFSIELDFGAGVFTGGDRWIAVTVDATVLMPRQKITATPYAEALKPGAQWTGAVNKVVSVTNTMAAGAGRAAVHGKHGNGFATVSGQPAGVFGECTDVLGIGVIGSSTTGFGVFGVSSAEFSRGVSGSATATTTPCDGVAGFASSNEGVGVRGVADSVTGTTYGVRGQVNSLTGFGGGFFASQYGALGREEDGSGLLATGAGVWGDSENAVGVCGTSLGNDGVQGIALNNTAYAGAFFHNGSDGGAVFAQGGGAGRFRATLRVHNFEPAGGVCTYMTNDSTLATGHFSNGFTGEVLYLENGGIDAAGNGGGDFIRCVNDPETDIQFRVLSSGEARSDVGFFTPAADFAEMLPAAAPGEIEPGDVLIVGSDGKLVRSTSAFERAVVGVYSTRPGFVGGMPVEGPIEGTIPLAVVGVVPVKCTIENGAIRPGDLLVVSSTPGHAMNGGGDPPVGSVLGKALEPLSEGAGTIRVLVTLQ